MTALLRHFMYIAPPRGAIRRSPILGALNLQLQDGLERELRKRTLAWSMIFLVSASYYSVFTVGLYLFLENSKPFIQGFKSGPGLSELEETIWLVVIGTLAGSGYYYCIVQTLRSWVKTKKQCVDRMIPCRLSRMILLLEANGDRISGIETRGECAKHLETLARDYLRLGRMLSTSDRVTGEVVEEWSRGVATSVRRLKLLVVLPEDRVIDYAHLLNELCNHLHATIEDRWEMLPVAPTSELEPAAQPLRGRLAWSAISAVLFAAAVAVLVFSTRFGASGPLLVSLPGVLAILALRRAGVPLEGMVKASDTFGSMRS